MGAGGAGGVDDYKHRIGAVLSQVSKVSLFLKSEFW